MSLKLGIAEIYLILYYHILKTVLILDWKTGLSLGSVVF